MTGRLGASIGLALAWPLIAGIVAVRWETFLPLVVAGATYFMAALVILRVSGAGWWALSATTAITAVWYAVVTPLALRGVCWIEDSGRIVCPGMNDVGDGATYVAAGIPLAILTPTIAACLARMSKEVISDG